MYCAVYKSLRKQDAYLYTIRKDDFSAAPEPLLKLLGHLVHVMDLELSPERKLAQEDVVEVMKNLQERGWHLQAPRRDELTSLH